jgi:DNA-binding SARP family transcriptional activator
VHRETTATLESWIAEEKLEIKRLPKLINLLESTLEAFIEADPKDYKQALGLYKAFMQTHATKKAKQAHLVMLQRAWKENAGIDSLQTVAETREKTLAAGRAKLQLRAEGAEDDKGKLPPAEAGSRAGFIMDAPPVVEVEDDWEGI